MSEIDMFGYKIKEKRARSQGPKTYTSCRWTSIKDGQTFICGGDLKDDGERERGLCARHSYCDDAKKLKSRWYADRKRP